MLQKYSSYILCLLISILAVALYIGDFSFLVSLEWKLQGLLYSAAGSSNYAGDFTLINIDDQAADKYGEWPWDRALVADLLAAVGSGEPKTVYMNIFFDYDVAQDTLGYTEILAGQMSWVDNVILPYEISKAEFRTNKISSPQYLDQYAVTVNNELGVLPEHNSLLCRKVFLPPELLCSYASGLGFKQTVYDSDRKVRWAPLVMNYEGFYYPSAELITAARHLGIEASNITVEAGKAVKLGGLTINTNEQAEMFINYNQPGRAFNKVSAADILAEKIDLQTLNNKLVIISVTTEEELEYYRTPVSSKLPAFEKAANIIENIVHGNLIQRMDSNPLIDLLVMFGIGILFAFIMPRVTLKYRLIIILASFVVVVNLVYILFSSYNLLTRPLYVGIELFFMLIAAPLMDNECLARLGIIEDNTKHKRPGLPKIKEKAETRVIKDESTIDSSVSESTDYLDQPGPGGSDELKKTVPSDSSVESSEVKTVSQEMPDNDSKPDQSQSTDYSDYQNLKLDDDAGQPQPESASPADLSGIASSAEEPDTPPEGFEPTSGDSSAISVGGSEAKPGEQSSPTQPETTGDDSQQFQGGDSQNIKTLGRYKVVGVVGQGAMGTVFKGLDPAINRNVALKTIRLDFVSDPEEFAELKERLFREARAAGMLSHPNIVTIYDVGTEGKLQYIAMEYIQGATLEDMIRRKVKFNLRIMSQMITQICSALEYAHAQKIVHRDIKPANIMVQKDYTVKVMDFGIARVDSTSMTRTGIAMGTPNYISPEQLQGKTIDHRCDIFSLGVMMYELLVGKRPFIGENLTALIYSIVNKEPEPPSSIDSSVPPLFDRIIEKALKKNPEERFQKASEVARALQDFIESFTPARKGF